MRQSIRTKGIVMSLLGVFVLSPDSLLIRLAALDNFTLVFYRGVFPIIAITMLLLLYYRSGFINVVTGIGWAGILNGFLYATTNITFIYSIQITSVANTLVILSSAPIFAAVLSLVVLKENQRPITWVVIGIALISITIIGLGSYRLGGGLAGDLFALVCAFTTGCSAVLVRYKKEIDLVPSVIIGSMIMAVFAYTMSSDISISSTQFIYVAIIGFLLVPFAFMILTIAPRFTSSAEVQLIYLLESILGPLWVWLVIRETPSINTFIGGAMLLTAVFWFAIHTAKQDSCPEL